MTIRMYLNGEPREVADQTSVAQLVADAADVPAGIAVAVNGEIVPRGSWADTRLRTGDRMELVTAVQGG